MARHRSIDQLAEDGTVPDAPPRFGMKLRHARRVHGLTLAELADRIGCSESLLSKIERDRVIPSLPVLHRMVSVLETNIASLFAPGAPEAQYVSRTGDRPVIHVSSVREGDGVSLECLTGKLPGELLQANVHIMAPGGSSKGCISHEGEEIGYVLCGQVELQLGDAVYKLQPGDSFHFPSEVLHGYRNLGEEEARILWVNTPPTF